MRCCFREKWTFFDNVDVWREALIGTLRGARREAHRPGAPPADEGISTTAPGSRFSPATSQTFVCRKISAMRTCAQVPGPHRRPTSPRPKTSTSSMRCWTSPPRTTGRPNGSAMASNSQPEYCRSAEPSHGRGIFRRRRACEVPDHGMYPDRSVSRFVRDTGALTLEEAHYHLSYMPAWVAGFKDRGAVREGLAADFWSTTSRSSESKNPKSSTTCRRTTIRASCSVRADIAGSWSMAR